MTFKDADFSDFVAVDLGQMADETMPAEGNTQVGSPTHLPAQVSHQADTYWHPAQLISNPPGGCVPRRLRGARSGSHAGSLGKSQKK